LVTSILWSSQKVDLAYSRENYAQTVETHAHSLIELIMSDNIYANNYDANHWLSSQNKFSQTLQSSPNLTPQQQTIQNSIYSQNANVKRLFKTISENQLKNASPVIKRHLKAKLINQLQAIKSDSDHLYSIIKKDIKKIIEHEVIFILGILTICVLLLFYGALRLNKIFRSSLNEVKKAFEKNHSGHFQKIQLSNKSSEFDSIVKAFNVMNKKLSETTVSLEVMKKVVDERTRDLEQLSNTDPLTNIANRRALFERGEIEYSRYQRSHHKLTLLLIDCDLFKNINDKFGHLLGDKLLKHVCKICIKEIRDIDFFARYGGEEFVIVLPDCDLNGGIETARRIQNSLSTHSMSTAGNEICMTLSIGICMFNDKHKSFEHLINDADQAMYQAKENGRNRIEVYKDSHLH
jgi:diguanylate cyclase (GGDEF)-like protein